MFQSLIRFFIPEYGYRFHSKEYFRDKDGREFAVIGAISDQRSSKAIYFKYCAGDILQRHTLTKQDLEDVIEKCENILKK